MLCKQRGMVPCHVKGSAALDAAHVQRAFAAFSIQVLIIHLTRAALAAAAHLFFLFQLGKVSINRAQADHFIRQRVRNLYRFCQRGKFLFRCLPGFLW